MILNKLCKYGILFKGIHTFLGFGYGDASLIILDLVVLGRVWPDIGYPADFYCRISGAGHLEPVHIRQITEYPAG